MTPTVPAFDLYAALSVTTDAPAEVIIAAHRALIRAVHPDLHGDPSAVEAARRLNIARDWLVDPARRRLYDRSRMCEEPAGVRARSSSVARPPAASEPDVGRGALDDFVRECAQLNAVELARVARGCREAMARDRGLAAAGDRLIRAARLAGRERMALRAADDARWRLEVWHGGLDASLLALIRWTAYAHAASDVAPGEAAVVLAPWRGWTPGPSGRDGRRLGRWPQRVQGVIQRLRADLGRAHGAQGRG